MTLTEEMDLELAKKSEVDKRDEVITLAFSGRSDKQYSKQRKRLVIF